MTVTGTGGVGKSRLARRIAADFGAAFPDGVWLVELADLSDGPLLASTVLAGLGLRDDGGVSVEARLIEHFRPQTALLLLDGCDRVVDTCATLVEQLLRAAPDLRVLCTSRRPLHITGEAVLAVGPLSMPPLDEQLLSAARLERYDAPTLFVDRALAVSPGLVVDDATARVVSRICNRLDGLPLALEFAADRLDVLSLEQLADRLEDAYRLLVTARRGAPERQRTLQALVDSSADLCTPAERLLWARLSVFTGRFDLDAAEGVCAGGSIAERDVLDVVAGLVDKSILRREDHPGGSWYRLPSLLREYGERRLEQAGEREERLEAHARWCVSLAEGAARGLLTPRSDAWAQKTRGHHANIRAALEYCLDRPHLLQEALRLAGALWFYWIITGRVAEGRAWLDRVISARPAPTRHLAFAQGAAAYLAIIDGAEEAEGFVRAAHQLEEELADPALTGELLYIEGLLEFHRAELQRAAERLGVAREALRAVGDVMGSSRSLCLLALVCTLNGDAAAGARYCSEFLDAPDTAGDNWGRGYIHVNLALVRALDGNPAAGLEELRHGARLLRRFDDRFGMAWAVHIGAFVFALAGTPRTAAVLLGAGVPHRASARRVIDDLRSRVEGIARPDLSERSFDVLVQEGRAMGLQPAVDLIIGAAPEPDLPAVSGSGLLSRREWEVATLVAEGRSNRDIAAALVISQRTAEGHVQRILGKLDFLSRTQIATWVTEQRAVTRQGADQR